MFSHFGVPTRVERENETYIEGAKVYITDGDGVIELMEKIV
jgi:hypothetical protein